SRLSEQTAAVLFDNPSFLGCIESNAAEIAALARSRGAETVVGVDPLSLGVLAPPSDFGADIVVGSTQPLGVHMSCGGGAGGIFGGQDLSHDFPDLGQAALYCVTEVHTQADLDRLASAVEEVVA